MTTESLGGRITWIGTKKDSRKTQNEEAQRTTSAFSVKEEGWTVDMGTYQISTPANFEVYSCLKHKKDDKRRSCLMVVEVVNGPDTISLFKSLLNIHSC